MMFDSGAHALGCVVVPAGVGNTELQAEAMATIRPRGYVGTPDFLKLILEKADELGHDTGSVGLGPCYGWPPVSQVERLLRRARYRRVPELRHRRSGSCGLRDTSPEGLVVDEDVLVEIVRPGTGDRSRTARSARSW